MFAMHRPGTRVYRPSNFPSLPILKEGVMRNEIAQIKLDNNEDLVVNGENPLFKGERGEKGDVGPRGKKGNPGKQGPKVLSWCKDTEVSIDEISSLITFPHGNVEYDISKIEIIVQGQGEVTFYLVEEQTGEKLATISADLIDDLTVISHEDIVKPASVPAILSLQAISEKNENPIKFLSLTVTMKRN